jgi:hypothetical protein
MLLEDERRAVMLQFVFSIVCIVHATKNTHLQYVKEAGARRNWMELKGYRFQDSLLEKARVSMTQPRIVWTKYICHSSQSAHR